MGLTLYLYLYFVTTIKYIYSLIKIKYSSSTWLHELGNALLKENPKRVILLGKSYLNRITNNKYKINKVHVCICTRNTMTYFVALNKI